MKYCRYFVFLNYLYWELRELVGSILNQIPADNWDTGKMRIYSQALGYISYDINTNKHLNS